MAETSTPESRVAQEPVDLTTLTIQRLRMTANSLGVKDTNKMTKVELIETIRERQSAAKKPEEPKPRIAIDLDDLAGKLGKKMAPPVAEVLKGELNHAVVAVCNAIWNAYRALAEKEGREVPTPKNDQELVMATTALIAQVSLSIDRLGIIGTKVDSLGTAVKILAEKVDHLDLKALDDKVTELVGKVEDLSRTLEQELASRVVEEVKQEAVGPTLWQKILGLSSRIWTSVAYYLWDPNRRAPE